MKSILKKGLLIFLLILLVSGVAFAQQQQQQQRSPAATQQQRAYSDLFIETGKEPQLTQQEIDTLKLVTQWQNTSSKNAPISQAADGSIQFIYGASQPTILCAILQVTDVQLEPGESVYSVHLGDTARWTVEPAITGTSQGEIIHLIIKPRDIGLQTSLVVTTNRRSYHMLLKSSERKFYPYVSFVYPDAAMARWQSLQTYEQNKKELTYFPEHGAYLGDLDFEYKVTGTASWKPLRVYNDGVKTIIQMPKTFKQTEAPTLLVMRKEGGWFSDDETLMVNYRLQGNRYIVDGVFDTIYLIIGAGSSQTKVIIEREGGKS